MNAPALTRRQVITAAAPIMAASVSAPLVGIVDIAVIGRTGDADALAAIALGTLVFNAIYFSLGFLRMGATALTAQADGASDDGEVRAALLRSAAIGGGVGLVLLALAPWIAPGAFLLFSGPDGVEAMGEDYVLARLWGAPATLAGLAIYGWLIGLRRTGAALVLQAVLNLSNAALSVLFVVELDMGVAGVGLGSALAQWLHLACALPVIVLIWRARGAGDTAPLLDARALRRLLGVNRDIFLRTIALLAGFYWFNEASLREGADVLAGNAILLQFISVAAFFLDGFAYITESHVGKAVGARDRRAFDRAVRLTTEQAALASILLSLAFLVFGGAVIDLLTTDPAAREAAKAFLPWCALAPLLGMPSWQLDGVMIGATRGPLMRNAMIASLAIYLAFDFALRPAFGGHGLWAAFLAYYLARAATLAVGYPGLRRALSDH